MTKRTRLFLFVSGGILVVGLGTGLVAAYMGGFQNLGLTGSSGPDELAYVPQDVRLVAFANIRDIMNSELRQKLKSLQPRNDNGLARFESETGVDVTRDVDYVLAAMGSEVATRQTPPLIFAHGRFDAVRIEGLVRSKGGTVEEYKGVRLISYTEPNGDMSGALAFLKPDLLAMGGAPAVRSAIDARSGAVASVTGNKDLMRLVHEADNGNVWVVARFDALTSGRLPTEVASRLPPINWLTVTGHINGGLKATVRAETRDDPAAKDLRDVVQGMLALVKMQSGQRTEIATVVNSIELGGEGKNVSLSLSIPLETIDLLAGMHAPGRGGPPPVPPAAPPAPEPPPATAP